MAMILCAAFSRDFVMARRTFSTSIVMISSLLCRECKKAYQSRSVVGRGANVFCSMSVSRSTSSMAGRVRSRRSRVKGEMEVKYRWKNIVCSIAGARSTMVHGAIRAGRRVVG
ncbi:hypothetical protein IG631_12452 [Alternaria alternata]|nr:hypothetical protein IG631_12452 [Alternaria alternata]